MPRPPKTITLFIAGGMAERVRLDTQHRYSGEKPAPHAIRGRNPARAKSEPRAASSPPNILRVPEVRTGRLNGQGENRSRDGSHRAPPAG